MHRARVRFGVRVRVRGFGVTDTDAVMVRARLG